jgi:sugar lactone lactonase YvrE
MVVHMKIGCFGIGTFLRLGCVTGLFFLTGLGSLHAQAYYTPYTFTTLAGMASLGNADGTNSAARFNFPSGTAVDNATNVYVTDTANHTIRKLTPAGTNWVVTTIAGLSGVAGSDDGLGSVARFHGPVGITIDAAGNLYVTDASNQTIRRLTPSGTNWIVTTIAGSAGGYGHADGANDTASFFYPQSLTVAATGELFVTDTYNHTIRKITPVGTNWVVTTPIGQVGNSGSFDGTNTTTTFNQPRSVAMDKNGVLFVADASNNTIRKITPVGTNWVASTIAGKVGIAAGTDGTGTNATLYLPSGIAVDTNGNVFVGDTENHMIRKLTPSGTNYVVTTPVGKTRIDGSTDGTNSAARFFYPIGVCLDKNGNLYVADDNNNEIRKVAPVGTNYVVSTLAGFAQTLGTSDGTNGVARFNSPVGIAADGATNLFVVDQNSSTIRKLVPTGTNWAVTTIAGQPNIFSSTNGLGTNALFYYPFGVAADTNGNIFVTDRNNQTIRRLTPSGTNYQVTTIAGLVGQAGSTNGSNSTARFSFPSGIAVDSATNLYVTDVNNSTIRKITPVGTNWVVSTIAGKVGIYDFADGLGTNAIFNSPMGIAVDKLGNVYVADSQNHLIRKLTPSGTNYVVATIAGQPSVSGYADGTNSDALLNYPESLTVDNSGIVYVADYSNSTIRKITPVGTNWIVTTLGGVRGVDASADGTGGAAFFNHSSGITLDKNGGLYIADTLNNTIRKGVAVTQIRVNPPIVTPTQVTVPFILENGSTTSFKLLQAVQPGSPWTTNGVGYTTNIPGYSYSFTIPLPGSGPRFYRVQTP